MKDKEIKLKEATIKRLEIIEQKINILNDSKSNLFLTILEHENIDLDKFEVQYDNGILKLKEKTQ